MRLSHSGMNTRPISQSKQRAKRKHLQSAVTRNMAPKLTMPDESELSGANLLPPMAPSLHQNLQAGNKSRVMHQNLIGESLTNSIGNLNHTSHTVLAHDRTRTSGISTTKNKKAPKLLSSKATPMQIHGNSSIRTLIRLANQGREDDSEEDD